MNTNRDASRAKSVRDGVRWFVIKSVAPFGAAVLLLLTVFACAKDLPTPPSGNDTQGAVEQAAQRAVVAPTEEQPSSDDMSVTAAEHAVLTRPAVAGAVSAIAQLRQLPAEEIQRWSRSLDQMVRVSRRGESSVAMRRVILQALRAESDAAFLAILQQLPVTITEVAGSREGVAGRLRTYAIRGKVYQTLFVPEAGPASRARPEDTGITDAEAVKERAIGPAAEESRVMTEYATRAYDDCSTTWDGYAYVGECATQEEIDGYLSAVAAMEAEVEGDYAEAQAVCHMKYGDDPYECQEPALEDQAATVEDTSWESDVAFVISREGESTGFQTNTVFDERSATCHSETYEAGVLSGRFSCAGEAINAVGSLGLWVASKWSLRDVMVLGASRGGAAAAYAAALGAGFLAGYGIGSWIVCMT